MMIAHKHQLFWPSVDDLTHDFCHRMRAAAESPFNLQPPSRSRHCTQQS